MSYEPLHQKYRPQTFADLVGQSAIADTLSNAIARQRIAPAYLFSGPRGTGKTSSARILAKSLNCANSEDPTPQPCGQCEICRAISHSAALDIIEIDAASNTGVDNIREIIERSSFAPVQCRYKIYIIDECLTGDTLITTAQGKMRIDDPNLKGKTVLSYNEGTQTWEQKKVLRWLNQGVRPTLKLKTTHSTIQCTENHLLRTNQGWIAAQSLQVGMTILTPDAPQDVIKIEESEKETVYDLEVEDNHNFVANGLLVHNCHMLSTAAFNALLKTLEEPPPRVIFVLATTDPQRVLPTIISRCQRFDFQRIPLAAMTAHLGTIAEKEAIEITQEALTVIAQVAQGGLRDAQSLLDQLSLLSGTITIERVWDLVGAIPEQDLIALLQAIKQQNGDQILSRCRQLMDRGREPIIVLENLAAFYRDLLIAKTAPNQSELVALTSETWQQLCEIAQNWTINEILAGQKHLQNSEAQIKHTTQPRLWLEVTLLGLLSAEVPNVAVKEAKVISKSAAPVEQGVTPSSTKKSPEQEIPASTNHHQAAAKPEKAVAAPEPKTTDVTASEASHAASPAVESETVESDSAHSERLVRGNETQIWSQVLERLSPPSKALFKEHCRLLAIEGNIAQVGVKNQKLLGLAKSRRRQEDLEKAFTHLLQQAMKVTFQVSGETQPQSTVQEAAIAATPPPPTQQPETSTKPLPEKKEETQLPPEESLPTEKPEIEETKPEESPAPATEETVSDETVDSKALEKIAKELASSFKGEVINFDQTEFSFLADVNPDAPEETKPREERDA